MNHPRNTTIVILFAALASVASAQEAKTRSQVEAEVTAAMHNGDMLGAGELGLTQRETHPDLYPSAPVVGRTREQARAETLAAIRDGDMTEASDLRLKDLYPGMYPADPVAARKTRSEVNAETTAAIRDGDMLAAGRSGLTENELEPLQYAHQRAIDAAAPSAPHSAPQTSGGVAN